MLDVDDATATKVAAETISVPVTAAIATLQQEQQVQDTEADKKAKEKKDEDPRSAPLDPQCP